MALLHPLFRPGEGVSFIDDIEDFFWPPHHDPPAPEWAKHLSEHLLKRLDSIVASIADLAAADQQVADELGVISSLVTKLEADFAALVAGVGNVTSLSTEDQATVDSLTAQAQSTLTQLQTAAAGIVAADPAAGDNPVPPAQ